MHHIVWRLKGHSITAQAHSPPACRSQPKGMELRCGQQTYSLETQVMEKTWIFHLYFRGQFETNRDRQNIKTFVARNRIPIKKTPASYQTLQAVRQQHFHYCSMQRSNGEPKYLEIAKQLHSVGIEFLRGNSLVTWIECGTCARELAFLPGSVTRTLNFLGEKLSEETAVHFSSFGSTTLHRAFHELHVAEDF